jgi:hypothetical protein
MTEPTITCPKCRAEIKLTESLAAPLLEATRQQFEQRLRAKDEEIGKREGALRKEQEEIAKSRESLDQQVTAQVKAQCDKIAADEARKARLALATDIEQKAREVSDLQGILKEREAKLAEAQKAQADVLRKQRELDDARREVELTIERGIQEKLASVRDAAKRQVEEDQRLKLAEKDEKIASMSRQIDELKRKAEQGSQQLQGEVLELELEALLRTKFPRDTIDPVAKGEHGGDLLHLVLSSAGQTCGTILWESKRTKNWSDSWLAKLRGDQRAAKAEFAVIVSLTLPKDMDTFGLVEDVWITSPRTVIPLAVALRHTLVELAAARQSGAGQETKMEMVYQYLTGPRFRQRVQAILEKYTEMRKDLDKERATMNRLWAKREEQIRCVIESTAGMYGDLQGIAGQTLPEIEGLTDQDEAETGIPVTKRLADRERRRVDAAASDPLF